MEEEVKSAEVKVEDKPKPRPKTPGVKSLSLASYEPNESVMKAFEESCRSKPAGPY